MRIESGSRIWIPCEVFPGPFPDERNVAIDSPVGRWVGFVDTDLLREKIAEGKTAIRLTVVEANEREVSARLPGQTPHSRYLTCSASWIRDVGAE